MTLQLLTAVKARLPAATEKDALERIARESGVPFHTLLKIVKGETVDPRVSTVQQLWDYLAQQAA